jgi:hypothetical protein
MEGMGFHWRANSRELKLTTLKSAVSKSKKIPDFVYDPGAKHGFRKNSVVVSEAKGSLSKKRARSASIKRLANKAYNDQVRHFIGAEGSGIVVASGFAIAFGAVPTELGKAIRARASTLAVASPLPILPPSPTTARSRTRSLSAAAVSGVQIQRQIVEQEQAQHQTQQQHWQQPQNHRFQGPGGPGGPSDGGPRREGERSQPSGRVAYANYEAAFQLCGALDAATMIRKALDGESIDAGSSEHTIQEFYAIEYAGGRFLVGSDGPRWFGWPTDEFFAIYEPSAETVLRSLSNNLRAPPPTLPIAVAPSAEDRDAFIETGVAIHGDGLAVLMIPVSGEVRGWDLRKGDWV